MKSSTLHLFVLLLLATHRNAVVSSSLIATTAPAAAATIKTTSVIATPTAIETSEEKRTTTLASVASSSSSDTIQDIQTSTATSDEKSRTARDLPAPSHIEPYQINKNNNGNNGVSCITLLQSGKEKIECREPNLADRERLQQQQQQQQKRQDEVDEHVKSLQQASQSLWHETQQSNRVRRTSKTPRTIQRLIAGHLTLSNDPAHSTTKILPPLSKSIVQSVATTTPKDETNLQFLEEASQPPVVSSTSTLVPSARKPYRSRSYASIIRNRHNRPATTTTTAKPSIDPEDYQSFKKEDDDEAFLEDPRESDNWDNGILRLSAGDGKEEKSAKKKLDPNKTLSEQVKDGKYGLIEQEIFKKPPKRPGILSYLQNKEFPHDNEKTLGGLNEDDIWLAEDHLLVIKGGGLNDQDKKEPWAPIDDFVEQNRPIKIPPNPQVPPPFPIQLGENEPIQFVGDNQITFGNPTLINESAPATISFYSAGDEDKNQIQNDDYDKENSAARKGSNQSTTKLANVSKGSNPADGYFYQRGNPAWNVRNETLINPFLNFRPFDFPAVPPNGSFDDVLDQFDEDDPSLYYPPPYSFVYKSNYTNAVPAGPLVPGIVLPPPPNAFSRLEAETTTRKPRPRQPAFRQKATRLKEYKPTSTSIPPRKLSTSIKSTSSSSTTTKRPGVQFDDNKEVVYAITETPSYGKVRYYTPSNRVYPSTTTTTTTTVRTPTEPAPVEEVVAYVPKQIIRPHKDDSLSLNRPIYYEYYDVKPTPAPTPEVYYKEILPPTNPPKPTLPLQHTTSPLPQTPYQTQSADSVYTTTPAAVYKDYATGKNKISKVTTIKPAPRKPHKHYTTQGKTYLTQRPYHFDDYVNIKPHPEIRPNGIAYYEQTPEPIKPSYRPKQSLNEFDREINEIRHTLQLFNGQQQYSDFYQSTHNPKAILEYSFDANKETSSTPKPQFDTEPFQPMVKYSSPVDDANGFRAITYPKANDPNYYNVVTESATANSDDRIRVQIIYDATPRPENGFYSNSPQATHSTLIQSQNPWISIEKQVVQEINNNGLPITTRRPAKRRPSSRKIEQAAKNNFNGYIYNPPSQPAASQTQRTNNRYFEEPFAKHLKDIRDKLSVSQAQPNFENSTNYEYITPRPNYVTNLEPFEQFLRERTFEDNAASRSPSQWNAQNVTKQDHKAISTTTDSIQQESWSNQQQQMPQQLPQIWSLESDINVNNIPYGRPPVNPDSEYINPIRQTPRPKTHRDKHRESSKALKPKAEPFNQYLREVTPSQNNAPLVQGQWAYDSFANEPYGRLPLNIHPELMEQSGRPNHRYRQQQQQQLPQQIYRINGAESLKQYVRKVAPSKNFNPHQPQLGWRHENDTNINKIQTQGRPQQTIESPAFMQRRPIYRDFAPPQKMQQPHHQQQQQQHGQPPCKWPYICNSNQNVPPQNVVVLPGHSLHSDTNVNFGQKLPPLNPNSEFINPYQPFLNDFKPPPADLSRQSPPKPIYNRLQHSFDSSSSSSSSYHQPDSYYTNNKNKDNNQRPPRPPK